MKTVLKIEGMTCGHCVKHATNALLELAGVSSAVVSLESKTATVEHDNSATLDAIKAAIDEVGYAVVD